MTQSTTGHVLLQAMHRRGATVLAMALALTACSDRGITNPEPIPNPGGSSHAGFDTSLYPGDAAMTAWLKPGSPYEWVGYYLAAPCHRDASWMGKRSTLTSMGWGFAVLYVGQQTFDGVPFIDGSSARAMRSPDDSLPPARAGIMVPPTRAQLEAGAVTCSRTLLSAEQGGIDAIDAISKTASEGFPNGTVIYLDIEHMDVIPASMDAYYRAWIQQVLADGRFRPGIYVAKSNAAAIHQGASQAYADMNISGSAVFWVASTEGFSLDKSPDQVGFAFASVWQGILETTQTWNGASINIDVDVAAMASPSTP
ncbi:MAG: glycoside hydrolase domain-containing protein [Gemmatimonadaceae bacterium]